MAMFKCEMCGSTDIIKQDGVFVCQSCGIKYSPEEAKKMMVEVAGTVAVKGSVKVENTVSVESLLKRAFMTLEDADAEDDEDESFDEADELFDRVLDIDPECAEAYLGKTLVEWRLKNKEEICNFGLEEVEFLTMGKNYQKAIRFGDETLVNTLEGYVSKVKELDKMETEKQAQADAEEKRKYESAMAEFKEIKERREKRINDLLLSEKKQLEETAKNKYELAVASGNEIIAKQTAKKDEAQKTPSLLKMFQLSEKKKQKDIVNEAEKMIVHAQLSMSNAKAEYENILRNAAEVASQSAQKLVDKEIPLPKEPMIPLCMLSESERNERIISEAVLEVLASGGKYKVSEMQEKSEVLRDYSSVHISGILRRMVNAGLVDRISVDGQPYAPSSYCKSLESKGD